MSVAILPTISNGSIINQEVNDVHKIYARDAQPYANLVYDKSLPFVPRYRYAEVLYIFLNYMNI